MDRAAHQIAEGGIHHAVAGQRQLAGEGLADHGGLEVHAVLTLHLGAGSSVTLNAELTAAAATHSRDMSVQNRPWHFGSDGSSPLVRVQRVGYTGKLLGELISETYETELETLAAWANQPDTRAIILDASANEMGFAWFQEPSGKIWWTLVTGRPGMI